MENFDSIAISHKFFKLLIILGSEKIDKDISRLLWASLSK